MLGPSCVSLFVVLGGCSLLLLLADELGDGCVVKVLPVHPIEG